MSNDVSKNSQDSLEALLASLNEDLAELEKLIPDPLMFIVKGYLEYASEVVLERAIPNIDGLKPSQRRILFVMKFIEKVKELTKSANVVGATMKLHPHGDGAIYDTLARLTQRTEGMNIPYIIGKGNFGKVYSNESPAAPRYTECKLASITEEFFREMEGVSYTLSYDDKLSEPELLPVSFPNILCNASQGIAVGLASNIPSFNFHDVLSATIELIETGDIKTLLSPDFSTRGYYVRNEHELRRLMDKGKAKIKLRGKWFIEGKTINITEIPYYTTVQGIMKELEPLKGKGIYDIRDETDINGLTLAIECSNKRVVDEILMEVLKISKLQMEVTTNIVTITDGKPVKCGVKQLIRNWVEFRKGVLNKTLFIDLDKVNASISNYETIVDLLSNETNRKKFIDLLTNNEMAANEFLKSLYPEKDNFDWILDQKLRSFGNLEGKIRTLNNLKSRRMEILEDLNDIERVIVRQLKELNSKYNFPRQTEITDVDYVFEKGNVEIKAEPSPTIVLVEGKFVKKILLDNYTDFIKGGIRCMSDDVISFIDNKGRLLRLNLDNIPFCQEYERGVYLPVVLEIDDDFDIIAYNLIEDTIKGYMYADGFASVVDYSEWVDAQRKTRLTSNGVSDKANLIMAEIDFDKEFMMLVTRDGRLGFVSTRFKQKNRTARTRVVNVKDNDEIVVCCGVNYGDMLKLVSSPERYRDKLSMLSKSDTFNTEFYNELLGIK